MNRSEQMLMNAVCLYTAPEVIQFSAMFSGLTELLEQGMSGFASAVSGQQADIDIQSHFADDLDGLVVDVLNQLQQQSDEILADYGQILAELESEGGLEPASKCIEHFADVAPNLGPLDKAAQPKDLLGYLSFMNKKDVHSKVLRSFIDSFRPIFDKMEEERRREIEEKKQNELVWFDAASSNDVEKLTTLLETGIDIDLEGKNRRKTALAIAVMNNSLESVTFLLSHNAKPTAFFDSDSPLIIAIENNLPVIVEAIISSKHESLQGFDWDSALRSHVTDDCVDIFRQAFSFDPDNIQLRTVAEEAIKTTANTLLEVLFDFGLDANDDSSSKPLSFLALEENNLPALRILFQHGANINAQDWHSDSLLQKAANGSSCEMIDLLLENGARFDHDGTNYFYQSNSLFNLAKTKGVSLSQCLKAGVLDYTVFDGGGKNLLHYAADQDEYDGIPEEMLSLCRALIEDIGMDVNQLTEDGENTALTITASETIFDYLLQQKPDLNLTFSDGDTLLEKVKHHFDGRAISKVLKAGAEPNSKINELPVLHRGIRDNDDYVAAIIENGADVNILDRNGLNILQKRIDERQNIEKYLLVFARNGADFNLNTTTGLPISHALCAAYETSLVKEIVKIAGIDLNQCDENGNNVIMQATLTRNIPNIIYLAESGVDANKANILGVTPLLHAVYTNDVELVRCLIEQCGANPKLELAGRDLQSFAMQFKTDAVLEYLDR